SMKSATNFARKSGTKRISTANHGFGGCGVGRRGPPSPDAHGNFSKPVWAELVEALHSLAKKNSPSTSLRANGLLETINHF
ncbi:hypothetical protein ABTK20_21645, partial [Acinetobacter baumannii]